MAEETKKTPQTPEEIAREAQAQAMKAALEQAQALYGNIPGFEGSDLMKMHEKLMQDSAEMFPGVAQAQAYQAKMMAESAQDPEAIMETYSKNIEFAGNMMQQAMNAGFMPEGLPDFSDGFDVYAGWEITRKGDNSLTPEQNRLLAYGAPLFLYNDDNVDSLESTAGTDTLKEMLEEWWEVTDRKSALETISWLLNEGQHAGADPALAEVRRFRLHILSSYSMHCDWVHILHYRFLSDRSCLQSYNGSPRTTACRRTPSRVSRPAARRP